MKLARRILIALMLGLVTTVGVAWGIAIWKPIKWIPPSHRDEWDSFLRWNRAWKAQTRNVTGITFVGWDDLSFFEQSASSPEEALDRHRSNVAKLVEAGRIPIPNNHLVSWGSLGQATPPASDVKRGMDYAAGWPWPCLCWRLHIAKSGRSTMHGAIHIPAKGGGQYFPDSHWLPFLPIWKTFTLEVLMYSAFYFALLFASAQIRRMHRRRHNRCEQCGYSLLGNPPSEMGCPECGWNRATTNRPSEC